jgi:hypothetical protein
VSAVRANQGSSEGRRCETPFSASGITNGAAMALAESLAQLPSLEPTALREEWRRLHRAEPPKLSRDLLLRAVAYRLQELAFGGLPTAARKQLGQLTDSFANDGRIALRPKRVLRPGARLVREWRGRTHTVEVVETGFAFEGGTYRSLTEIAHLITGAHWSGPRFFGLTRRRGKTADTADAEAVANGGVGVDARAHDVASPQWDEDADRDDEIHGDGIGDLDETRGRHHAETVHD